MDDCGRGQGRPVQAGALREGLARLHPLVPLAYCLAFLLLSMLSFQPVLIALSLGGSLVHGVGLRGWKGVRRSLSWQLPLAAVVALANPLFTAAGSTELFRVGVRVFYAESFVYGACMGAMLVAMLVAFSNFSDAVGADDALELVGRVMPTVGLMVSLCMRLVPQIVRRGRGVSAVQAACTAAYGGEPAKTSRLSKVKGGLRLSSVLMGWTMEESLQAADSMKARGWASGARRTHYSRRVFRAYDAAALAAVLSIAAASATAAAVTCGRFSFYPVIEGWANAVAYLPFALFVALPLFTVRRRR